MAIFFKDKNEKPDELKAPYVKVRHMAIFESEEDAISTAKRLNYGIYHPLGLTKEEMKTLFDEERSIYGVKEVAGKWNVIQRCVY